LNGFEKHFRIKLMAQSEQVNVFVARLLAAILSVVSALFAYKTLTEYYMDAIAAQAFTILTILVLGSIRARVGAKGAYAHPLGVITILLLLPAQFATLLLAFILG
jgi:hypothetical protein